MEPGKPIVGSPDAVGGIPYAEQAADLTDLADVAFAVQFTADTPLAVERAIVETWKLLHDECSRHSRSWPCSAGRSEMTGAAGSIFTTAFRT